MPLTIKNPNTQKFINDLNAGAYDFTKDGKCTRCGNCCTALLPMSKDEVKAIQRYIKRKHIKPIPASDMSCPFYDKDKKCCNVYEVRPLICRDFMCNKMHNNQKPSSQFDNRYKPMNLQVVFGG